MAVQEDSTSMRFGNYEVLTRPDGKPDELGRGGFGRTYRARHTAEALYYANRRNILHRDIKPSNLLLVFGEGAPQVKLIDFGLVKRIVKVAADETIDHASASQWSPAFASPEQIRELALDERTDIFSLGMTAWFLIAGGGPVEGATMEIVQD